MGGNTDSSHSQSLPTLARVRKRREFLTIQRVGRRHPTRHFLLIHAVDEGSFARLGITVTRKIGGAVERNRVKRAVREVFRKHRERLQPGTALVVIAREGSPALGSTGTAAELGPVLGRFERTPEHLGHEGSDRE